MKKEKQIGESKRAIKKEKTENDRKEKEKKKKN